MAKGFETNQERLRQLSLLGKELTRRSRATCELCTQSGVALSLYEVPPVPKEPAIDKVLHLCENCISQLENPKKINPDHWRILGETIWSEVPVVQVMATRMLRHLAKDHFWAQEILEGVYLDETIEDWVKAATLAG
ncbi:MAG: phnA protein [Verrucomicrobiae bacterium]|nr:phnA protein [Verrucomicrobiae bacterium]